MKGGVWLFLRAYKTCLCCVCVPCCAFSFSPFFDARFCNKSWLMRHRLSWAPAFLIQKLCETRCREWRHTRTHTQKKKKNILFFFFKWVLVLRYSARGFEDLLAELTYGSALNMLSFFFFPFLFLLIVLLLFFIFFLSAVPVLPNAVRGRESLLSSAFVN